MLDLEKQRLPNFVADLNEEELDLIVRQLHSDILIKEIDRREKLKSKQLSAISLILSTE